MKNVLVGNGINIQFGGYDEYSNSAIIERLITNTESKDYSKIIPNFDILISDLSIIIPRLRIILNQILLNEYDAFCKDDETKIILKRFKKYYSRKTSIAEIGMEDFLFIMHLFHEEYFDEDDLRKEVFHGMCWIFLDAIFNEGKIQKIYESITPTIKSKLEVFFGKYDNLYTVNYDCNLEEIANKEVRYLHGSFNTLLDQYNPNTILGKAMELQCFKYEINDVNSHIYSNCIFGYSGKRKEYQINIFDNLVQGYSNMFGFVQNGITKEQNEQIELLKINNPTAYYQIKAIRDYKISLYNENPWKKFQSMNGEIHIIGMSPNNDEHIWAKIIDNPKITKIVYHFHNQNDKESVESLYDGYDIELKPVAPLWE